MPSLIIDDSNTTLIQYTGSWQQVPGSTRQWEGGVHVTGELGAKATFGFRGYSLKMWGTIATGAGSSLVDIAMDGGQPLVSTKKSNGSAVYDEVYYDSGLLRETFHTVVITNRGSTADGYTEFMLDRFQFETTDESPLFPTLGTPSAGTTPPTGSPIPGVQGASTKSNNTPLIATGVVIGLLAIGLVIFAIFLLKTRRQLKQFRNSNVVEKGKDTTAGDPSVPVPFPTTRPSSDPSTPSNITTSEPRSPDAHSSMSEKAALRSARSNTTMSPSVSALPSSTDTNFSMSSSRLNQPSIQNFSEVGSRGSESTAPSNGARSEVSGAMPRGAQSSAGGSMSGEKKAGGLSLVSQEEQSPRPAHSSSAYDNPPPSYWTQPAP